MPTLNVLVDFDNIDLPIKRGPLAPLIIQLVQAIPAQLVSACSDLDFALYGGWREGRRLTTAAQNLAPQIQAGFPMAFTLTGTPAAVQVRVHLVFAPLCTPTSMLEGTFVRDRTLRRFAAKNLPWAECVLPGRCGLNGIMGIRHNTQCSAPGCGATVGGVLVRNEQKMVDTSMVVDIAYLCNQPTVTDIVIFSSDADIWPGVLLALSSGRRVTRIHPKLNAQPQRHLHGSIPQAARASYTELSC